MTAQQSYLACLFAAIVLLIAVLFSPFNEKSSEEISALVTANTLTQSLDGHRRYLTVQLANDQRVRVSVPTTVECPVNSTVLLEQSNTFSETATTLKYVSCR